MAETLGVASHSHGLGSVPTRAVRLFSPFRVHWSVCVCADLRVCVCMCTCARVRGYACVCVCVHASVTSWNLTMYVSNFIFLFMSSSFLFHTISTLCHCSHRSLSLGEQC